MAYTTIIHNIARSHRIFNYASMERMIRMKLQVKKIIALAVTMVYVLASLYSLFVGKATYNDILPVVAMVIGYYFGRGHGEEIGRDGGD